MENLVKAYEALFMLACSNVKKALAFAEAVPKEKIFPDLLIGYMKSDNENVRSIAEQLLMKTRVFNLNYKMLAKAAETDNEEVIRVILLMARRFEKRNLDLVGLKKLTASKFYGVRQFAFTLIVKNYVNVIPFSLLVKCQEVDDPELATNARDVALKKCNGVKPRELFKLLESKVPSVRKLVKDICLSFESDDYSFTALYKILKTSEDPDITSLSAIILLQKFGDRLSFEDLMALRIYENEEVRAYVPWILMERYSDKLEISDYLDFQTNNFGIVRARAKALAHSSEDLDLHVILMMSNSPFEEIRMLAWDLAHQIKIQDLDYALLIEWHAQGNDFSNNLASSLLRKMPNDMFDPEVLARYQNSEDDYVIRIATELALSVPCDYSKEAHDFIKTYFV